MSKPGDVVWADGRAWQKDMIVPPSPGRPSWYSPLPPDTFDLHRRLKHLKAFKDFRWLVKDGEVVRNYDDAVKEYERVISTLKSQVCQWKENFDNERAKVTELGGALSMTNAPVEELLDAERAAFSRGARAGEKCERAVIVKWLRDYCEKYPGHHNYRVTRNIANDIERGEHLAGNDE